MSLNDKIESIKKLSGKWAERISGELAYAASLSLAKNRIYDEIIEKSADTLLAAIENDGGVVTKASALAAEEILMPLKDAAKAYKVHCVSHAHIDMNWMWGFQETASITVDTFRTVLDLMKEYPTLTFGQSQASTYKIIEEFAPEMLEEIKERIKEGRWEITASTWVETDKNMPNGESLARHILYTKRYLSNLLDIPAESLNLDFEPDTFGHNISVPEICSKGGVKYYYHCRGNSDEDFVYRWRARSGSELLVWREPAWYNFTINGDMFKNVPQLCEKYGIDTYLSVYGVGDHGGGPTRRDIDRIIEISSWPIMPTVIFSTYGNFFKELEAYRENFPVREGELNFVFTGCYTSQSRIKMSNRIAEDRMYESEMLSTAANVLADNNRHNDSFKNAWESILFNHFHDILPGSGVVDTREYALGQFQRAMAAILTNANLSMRAIAEAIDTSQFITNDNEESTSQGAGVGFLLKQHEHYKMPVTERGFGKRRILHLFNTTAYDYEGVTNITVWDWDYETQNAVFTDTDGNEVKSLCLFDGPAGYWMHFYKTFAVEVKVPAFGYATYILDRRESGAAYLTTTTPRHESTDTFSDDNIVMENSKLCATFDHRTMQLISLIDKNSNKELINKPSATFRLIHENLVHGMTSWRVGEYMSVDNLNETCDVVVNEIKLGSICQTVKYHLNFGKGSALEVTVKLTDESSMLDFDVTVDFHEIKQLEAVPQLNFTLPVGYAVSNYRYDVPFATIDRPEIKHDVPANSYGVALPEGENEPAIMLTCDTKYGFRGSDNSLSLALIRASGNPDPYPEYGKHNTRIGVGIVKDCEPVTLNKAATHFVHPISVCSARAGKGTLPTGGQLFKFDGELFVSAVKTAEDKNAIIIRLSNPYETEKECNLTFAKEIKSAHITDLNENIMDTVSNDKNTLKTTLKPYEIETLLVEF